jgi:putative endonuclease
LNYVYILECFDNSLYTGFTNDLEKRVRVHNSGKGAKYTRCRLPVKLVYYEEFETKREAMKREYCIKQLSRDEKISLIKVSTLSDISMEKGLL